MGHPPTARGSRRGFTLLLGSLTALALTVGATPALAAPASGERASVAAQSAGTGWTEITLSGTNSFLAKLQEALVAQHGQSAGAYDYSVVTRLKINGSLSANDATALRNSAYAGSHLTHLDLSGMTSGSARALNGLPQLTEVVLPSIATLTTGNLLADNPRLTHVSVSAATTNFGSTSTFARSTSLQRITFLGTKAPTLNASTFAGSNNADADARTVVAVVGDRTSGGYQKAAFRGQFADVVDNGTNPSASTDAFAGLGTVLDEARGTTRISAVKDEKWTALQDAVTEATRVLGDPTSTSGAVEDARIALREGLDTLLGTTFKVTKGATVGLYQKGTMHFTPFTAFDLQRVPELSDASHDVYVPGAALANGTYNVQASVPGETDKVVRVFTVNATSGTSEYRLDLTKNADRAETPLLIPGLNAGDPRNLYTNLDDTGAVELDVDGTFALDTFRTSQAQPDQVQNYFIEPDFEFEVAGDAVATERIGAEGRRQLKITGTKPGVSVVSVGYGALKYVTAAEKVVDFNPIDEQNTGLAVIEVGGVPGTFDTGISTRNDLDTYYFDRTVGSRQFSFTPAAGTKVRVHDPLNVKEWGSGWKRYTAAADGSFDIRLKGGRTIVELTNGDVVEYRVLRAKAIDVEITNATNPGAAFVAGDQASLKLTGIEGGIEKLAGIYNPAFMAGTKPQLTYSDGATEVKSNQGGQYTSATTTFALNWTYSGEETALDGALSIGGLGAEWPYHREIPLTGKPANLNAVAIGPYSLGALPTIHVYDGKVTTRPKVANVSKEQLAAEIDGLAELTEADFTPASWAGLTRALTAARAVLADDDAVQVDVDEALTGLTTAADALVRVVAPAAPEAPRVAVDGTTATVTWQAPQDGGSAITGYSVTLTGGTDGPRTRTVAGDVTQVDFEGLAPGTYRAQVTATNARGLSPASTHSAEARVVRLPEVSLTLGTTRLTYGRSGQVAVTVKVAHSSAAPVGSVRAKIGTRTVTAKVTGSRAVLAVPATAWAPGKRAFTVDFVGEVDGHSLTARTAGTASVAKASASVKVKSTAKVKPSKVARVRVSVTASGVRPTGKVKVSVAGVTKTVKLRGGKTLVKIRVPKKAKTGKRTVVVKYLGSTTVSAKTSRTARTVVRR